MNQHLPAWLVAAILGAITAWGLLLWLVIRFVFARLNGWNRLARRYRAPTPPRAWQWDGLTVKVGAINYRRCVRLTVEADALCLAESGLLRHPPLRIPFTELHAPRHSSFYGRPTIIVTVGQPPLGTLEFPADVYARLAQPLRTSI